MLTKNYFTFFIFFCSLHLFAGKIKGKITLDQRSEIAIGANVYLRENTNYNDISGIDGSYQIDQIPTGDYTLIVSYYGYQTLEYKISVNAGTVQAQHFDLGEHINNEIEEVVISYQAAADSERTVRSLERESAQVMNAVSGKAIQASADLTVANVIQRISGVSLERSSNGDGQYAILRGMDKRYNYTLINGIKIASPDNKNRFVPLDIFPSELLDRLEVHKALLPNMEGDAIGGAVNLVMKDAPKSSLFQANFSTGISGLFSKDRPFQGFNAKAIQSKSPFEQSGSTYEARLSDFNQAPTTYKYQNLPLNLVAGLALGDRFFKDKLGVLVAANLQNTYRGSNSTFFDFEKVDVHQGVTLTKLSERKFSEHLLRASIHSKMDYKFNESHQLQYYTAYMYLSNAQVRDERSMQLTIGGYNPEKGNGTLGFATRSRLTNQSIYNNTLKGIHALNSQWIVDWSLAYSLADQDVPDNTIVPLLGTMENFVDTKTYISNSRRRWENNSDRDFSGLFDVKYKTTVNNRPLNLATGALIRSKKRANFYNQYNFRPAHPTALYGADYQSLSEIDWVLQNPMGSVATSLTYDAAEKLAAGYIQVEYQAHTLNVTGGVRVENTQQSYAMTYPMGEDQPEGKQEYTDFLPSIHFKYTGIENSNLRMSYFRSLNRPGFFEIVPYKVVNDEYQERGNPDLKRAIADNLDLRYEWFPSMSEQIMAGVFYKKIKDPIEFTLQRDPVRGQDLFYGPGNFGTAHNYGLELDFIKYFKKFGIKANYTYTDSNITTDKSERVRDVQGNLQTRSVTQKRPLYGQSKHIANMGILYKDVKSGWDAQLAANFTGERIATVSQFLDNDLWQKSFVQLDFSIEKTFNNKWTVYAKAANILNTPMQIYMKGAYNNSSAIAHQEPGRQTLIQKDYYEASYLIGMRYKL